MSVSKLIAFFVFALTATGALAAPEQHEGVVVGKPSAVRKLVPAEGLERQATQEFSQLKQQAAAKKKAEATTIRILIEAPYPTREDV